jgi:hypothetical protein
VIIPAGQKYGFYITMTAGTGTLESHNTLPEGSIGAQDGQIILYTGKGQANVGVFTGSLTAALTFQGTIQYSCATSVEEELNTGTFSVFPNPSNGILTLVTSDKGQGAEGIIEIYNSIGEKVTQCVILSGAKNLSIDLSSQPKGIYFVRLVNEGQVFSQKIVIE